MFRPDVMEDIALFRIKKFIRLHAGDPIMHTFVKMLQSLPGVDLALSGEFPKDDPEQFIIDFVSLRLDDYKQVLLFINMVQN